MAKTILLADDSITIQKIVNLTFSGEGIDVVTVGNGDAAIKKVYDIHPDLVLADIFMPGKNGYEVCEYIKGELNLQRIPVILLVGAFEPFDSSEAARVKADGHLTKPFEIKVLISAVNSLISAAEEDKLESNDHEEGVDGQTETSPAGIALDSYAKTEAESPVLVTPHTTISESASSELRLGCTSPTLTSTAFVGEFVSAESPVVDVDQNAEQVASLDVSEDPLDTAQGEEQIPIRPSIAVEDFDPLGLYASESIAEVGLQETEAPLDSKGLVVDIWEARSTPPSELENLPEVVEHHVEVPLVSTAAAFKEPAYVESIELKVSQSAVVDSSGQKTADLASERVVSSPPSLEPGTTPLTDDRAQADEPAILSRAKDQSELVDIVVQRVMEKLSREVIEKIAWEVVPDLAEIIIKEQVESHFKASGRV
jgi:CheY-like chemotaxis protein